MEEYASFTFMPSQLHFSPILFDLDGTLVDSRKDIVNATNRTLKRLGLPPLHHDEIIQAVGDGVRRLMERTLARFERKDIDHAIGLFKEDYFQNCQMDTKAYPGIPELLVLLKGHPLGVVTNKPIRYSLLILEGLDLRDYFGAVVGGDETEHLKPHPAPLQLACQRLGQPPETGIMIGDYSADIQAGRKVGMATCGVLWGFDRGATFTSYQPDYLCATPDDLKSVLIGNKGK